MQKDDLIGLTADIVSAHVSNNKIPVNEMENLVRQVFEILSSLGNAAEPQAPAPAQPAVPVRASVRPDHVTCHECGKRQKTLRRHLMSAHDLDPKQYRERFGLKADHKLVAPNYSETRMKIAKSLGLGRKQLASKPARRRTRAARTA